HRARPRRHCHSRRASLRATGAAAPRRSGHGAAVPRRVQHARRYRRIDRRPARGAHGAGMSDELRALYREVILDHSPRPRIFRARAGAAHADGYNPMCGDRITVYVDLAGGILRGVAFQGSGCAIAMASASMLTEAVAGLSSAAAAVLGLEFRALIGGPP